MAKVDGVYPAPEKVVWAEGMHPAYLQVSQAATKPVVSGQQLPLGLSVVAACIR